MLCWDSRLIYVSFVGFDGLRGLTTTDLKVLVTPESDGTNMEATVNIPNPSVMTLDLVRFWALPNVPPSDLSCSG